MAGWGYNKGRGMSGGGVSHEEGKTDYIYGNMNVIIAHQSKKEKKDRKILT